MDLRGRAHGGQVRKAVGLGALHASAFVVDANEHVAPNRANGLRQRGQLRARFEVAREQDHATRQRMGNAANVVGAKFKAGNIQNDWAGVLLLLGLSHAEDLVCNSATAKATA